MVKKGFKRVTLSDIAQKANVSRATVSLALNDKGALPDHRREEIKRIAAMLNYVPNPIAQALRGGKTRSIGVVINYFSNIYFRDFYIGLEEVADAEGFSFMASQTFESLKKERQQVAKFLENGTDGLIVLPCSQETSHLEQATSLGVPVVLISNTLENDYAAVVADNIRGTEMATMHLLSTYDRPILHIAGPLNQSCLSQRRDTFCSVVARERNESSPEHMVYVAQGLRSQEGYRIMETIIQKHSLPFSLFVCNDELAMGVICYCKDHGISLPDQVALACFSGDTRFHSMNLPVSTVTVPARNMGKLTARILLDLIENPESRTAPPIITLPVTLYADGQALSGENLGTCL